VQTQATPRRILAALGVAALLALVVISNVMRGKWSITVGVIFGLAALPVAFAVALTPRQRSGGDDIPQTQSDPLAPAAPSPARQFRNRMIQWLIAVAATLIVFRILDAFHVPWRQYLGR
jgi:hypothetical protein